MITSLPTAVTAIPIGIAFGVILERVGLGDPYVISGQLVGRDFTVVRVMFGTIVVAMLGVLWLDAAGVIDAGALAMPPTDLPAQALGAVIFGGGFALAALCPGTACVAASSGRRDGLAAVGGMFAGTALTPALWPALGNVASATPREGARLPEDLGWPLPLVVVMLTAAWVGAEMLSRLVERRGTTWWRPTTVESVALALALAFGVASKGTLMPASRVNAIARQIASEDDHVDPLELAQQIRARREGLRIIDVREGLDTGTYMIPGAEAVSLERLGELKVRTGEHLVLYSDGGAHAAQGWVLLRARGITDVKVVKDGMAAWEDEVMTPSPPRTPSDSAARRFERARELAHWFGGRARAVPALPSASNAPTPPRRRRGTC